MLHIMVTNDDGYDALGIKELTKAILSVKDVRVTVIAPEREQSGASHALSFHSPLRIKQYKKNVYSVSGTPTDCVYLGLGTILKNDRPDFVFSGINRGGNLGDDVHYSGTVSAAMEAGLMNVPAVAFSQVISSFVANHQDYKMAGQFAIRMLKTLKKNKLPQGTILNVNVPQNAQTLEFKVTKTGKRDDRDYILQNQDPYGRPYYWIGGSPYQFIDIKESDCNAIREGFISVTPLKVDLTQGAMMKTLREWDWAKG